MPWASVDQHRGVQIEPGLEHKGRREHYAGAADVTPLAVFALFGQNCRKVFITYDGPIYGVEDSDTDKQLADFVKWNQGRFCESCQRYGAGGGINYQYNNPGFSRNKHAMSERTV